MNKYIIILLVILSSCGSRKVQVNNVDEKKNEVVESHLIDTSKTIIKENINVKVLDTSEESEVCIIPIDTTKAFMYDNKLFKNVVLKIKKRKNNITTNSNENSSQIKQNGVVENVKVKKEYKIETKEKQIEKKESLLSYWWILLLIIGGYIAYRKYIK